MKNLLEHKKESTKITVLPDWEKVYKDLREILEVPEDWECNSEKFVKSDIDDEYPFEVQFLDFFIRDFLKLTGPIWNNVFYFQRKGAGGISSFDDAEKFMSLGADRLGTSRIVKIVKNEQGSGY